MATARRLAIAISNYRENIPLSGLKNGLNTTFTTPDYFIHTSNRSIKVYRNGQRLYVGVDNDFTVSESGGAGSGYDTVDFNGPAPKEYEILLADYYLAD